MDRHRVDADPDPKSDLTQTSTHVEKSFFFLLLFTACHSTVLVYLSVSIIGARKFNILDNTLKLNFFKILN